VHRRGDLPARYLDVEQDDIRVLPRRQRHRGRAVAGLADNLHVLLGLEDPV
jgi:hypothetical protein